MLCLCPAQDGTDEFAIACAYVQTVLAIEAGANFDVPLREIGLTKLEHVWQQSIYG